MASPQPRKSGPFRAALGDFKTPTLTTVYRSHLVDRETARMSSIKPPAVPSSSPTMLIQFL